METLVRLIAMAVVSCSLHACGAPQDNDTALADTLVSEEKGVGIVEEPQPVSSAPQFVISELPEADGIPKSSVNVRIGGADYPIAVVSGHASATPRDQYPAQEIPSDALDACGAWWSGAGEYFYLADRGGKIELHQGWADEAQKEQGYHWKKVREW